MSRTKKVILLAALCVALCGCVIGVVVWDFASAKDPLQWVIENPSTAPQLININTATVDDLCTVDGLGKTQAEFIVAYREKFGNFKSVSDLLDVRGVTREKFNQWKPYLTV